MKSKKKRRHIKKIIGFLAFILIVCVICSAAYYKNEIKNFLFKNGSDENIIQICDNIGAGYELAQLSSSGDILKIDFINPALDTCDLTTVIYSTSKSKVLSQTDFKNGYFETGLLNNGYYLARLDSGIIELYDLSGKKTSEIHIPSKYSIGFLSVSKNGEYVCFGDGKTAQILIADKNMNSIKAVSDFTGYAKICYTEGSSFFVQLYENSIMEIDAETFSTKQFKATKNTRIINEYGSISPNEDGLDILNTDGKKTGELTINKIDEIPIAMSMERILTAAGNGNSDILTAYNKEDGKYFSQEVSGSIYSAVDMQNGYIALSTVSSESYTKIYLIDVASRKLTTNQNQSQAATAVSEKEKVTEAEKKNATYLITDVPIISQYPDFPTGCESISAVIAMQYSGDNISPESFIDDYLEKSSNFYSEDGIKYGPDPYAAFIGSPRSKSAYGCMAPVIENAMNKYYQGRKTVKNLTGSELETLCNEYINKNVPCLIWASIDMLEPKYTRSWTLSDGSTYRWLANEHCMVLIGYDDTYYYFSDPYKGAMVKYEKTVSEKRFEAFGRQALAILK